MTPPPTLFRIIVIGLTTLLLIAAGAASAQADEASEAPGTRVTLSRGL